MGIRREIQTGLLKWSKSVFIINNIRGIKKLIALLFALFLFGTQMLFSAIATKNGNGLSLFYILVNTVIMICWLVLALYLIKKAQNRYLVPMAYYMLVCVAAGFIFYFFLLYKYMIFHSLQFHDLMLPLIQYFERLNQTGVNSRIITMILSASVILTLRDVMKWTESVPEPSYNVFSVRELGMHKKVIIRFVMCYSLYFFYWLFGHETFSIFFSIVVLLYVIGEILMLNYPNWKRDEIAERTIAMLIDKVRKDDLELCVNMNANDLQTGEEPSKEFITNDKLVFSLAQIMIAFHRMFGKTESMKSEEMAKDIIIGFLRKLTQEYNRYNAIIPYYCIAVGLGCGMHIQPKDLVTGQGWKAKKMFRLFGPGPDIDSDVYRYLFTGMFCALIHAMSDRYGEIEALGNKQCAIKNLYDIYISENQRRKKAFIMEALAISLCGVDSTISKEFYNFSEFKIDNEEWKIDVGLFQEMTLIYLQERACKL